MKKKLSSEHLWVFYAAEITGVKAWDRGREGKRERQRERSLHALCQGVYYNF